MEFDKYFVVFLKIGPEYSGMSEEEVQQLQVAHLAHIRHLATIGKLIIAGPTPGASNDLRGLFILKTDTLEEAYALVGEDPAIKSGRLQIEIAPWMVEKGSLKTTL